MYVCTPSWLVATPWLVPILLRPLVKVRGSSPRRGSSPLLIVPTPKGWKAEYTLASRMQIHESLRVLALLTRGEARTSDPWICSLMLYHLSYLTTYIHTYIHTYPDHKKFTPKHLAEQVRNIKKKKLLPSTEISRINDGTGEDGRETSTQETREHNEEIQTEQANSETENQEDIEEGTENIIEDENNIYREPY